MRHPFFFLLFFQDGSFSGSMCLQSSAASKRRRGAGGKKVEKLLVARRYRGEWYHTHGDCGRSEKLDRKGSCGGMWCGTRKSKAKALHLEPKNRMENMIVTAFRRKGYTRSPERRGKGLDKACPAQAKWGMGSVGLAKELEGQPAGIVRLFPAIGICEFLHTLSVVVVGAVSTTPCGLQRQRLAAFKAGHGRADRKKKKTKTKTKNTKPEKACGKIEVDQDELHKQDLRPKRCDADFS